MKELRSALRTATIGALRFLIPFVYGAPFRKEMSRKAKDIPAPRRILLINCVHIGDLVIATSVIPILRAAFPKAEIGFATASWAQMAIQNHPDIQYIHCIDHWRNNRGSQSFTNKKRQYRETLRKARAEIENLRYDVAISLFSYFPDFLDVAWWARIPVRIGFSRSIFAGLATDLVDEPDSSFTTQGARLAETLRVLPIDESLFALRRPTLPPSSLTAMAEAADLLGVSSLDQVRYRIVHMGTGSVRRELPLGFWREFAEKLSREHQLVFTGRGAREHAKIEEVIRGLPNCLNACNRLSWDGFVAVVRQAEILYGVESMAGHLAAAVGTRCVVVYGGTAGVARWRPEGGSSLVITNHVPCAPCLQADGCAAMTCMQNISPDDLIRLQP